MTERFELDGRHCAVYRPCEEGVWPFAVLCGGNLSDQLELIAQEVPPMILFCAEAAWERDYTPWPVPSLPEREPFTGEAAAYLRFLTQRALPFVRENYAVCPASALLGYSLGGLFALWAAGQTEEFRLFGSLSGALWYEGWLDYAAGLLPGEKSFYLSLGKAEPGRGGPRLGQTGNGMLRTQELLLQHTDRVTVEWNRGGHFTGIVGRWRKALCWAASQRQL